MTASDRNDLLRTYLEHRDALHGLAWKILRACPDEIEDVLQEAWIRAQRAWPPREPQYAKSWLGAIVVNLAIGRYRKRKRAMLLHLDDNALASPRLLRVPCPRPVQDAQVAWNQRVLLTAEAVRRLPRGYRDIVLLRHVAGLSEEETAAFLGLKLGTVKSQNHKAVRKLRETLMPKAA